MVTTQKWSKDYQNTVNLNTQEYKENTDKSICFGQGHKIGQEIMEKQQIEKKLFFLSLLNFLSFAKRIADYGRPKKVI